MDLYPPDSQQELRLRMHVREILLPYARTHLTTDHVAFTEYVVEDLLLHNLESVPLADAASFFLPTDPFDLLVRSLDALSLKPYEERWAAPAEIIPYLKSHFPPLPPSCELRNDKCWEEEDHEYEKVAELCRPMSPVLTARARRNTPQLGGTRSRESVPRTKSSLLSSTSLKSVHAGDVVEPPAPKMDDVLDLRYKLDASAHVCIRSLFQSVLKPSSDRAAVDNTPNIDGFLRCESPPIQIHPLASPPLFSRSARASCRMASQTNSMTRFDVADVAPLVKRASVELLSSEADDIGGRHLEVVDGWTTNVISSPPLPCRRSSSPSDVDELWDVSAPGTPATSLIAVKMEEIEIPRVRKFGCGSQKPLQDASNIGDSANLFAATKSPGSFIKSLISPALPAAHANDVALPNAALPGVTVCSSPRPSTRSSLEGQPPTILAEHVTHANGGVESHLAPDAELDLDTALEGIYASTPHDAASFVLEEKLDEGQIMLMDVPELPPPTHHARESVFFPDGTRDFVTTSNKGGDGVGRSACANAVAFLKPVKGIKPLALDLSWRPFNFGKSIPTNEEVARIEGALRCEDFLLGVDQRQQATVRELVENASPSTQSKADVCLRGCEKLGTSPVQTSIVEGNREHFEYVLTNRERLRLGRDASYFGPVRGDEDGPGESEDLSSADTGESRRLLERTRRSENKGLRCERDQDARRSDDECVRIDSWASSTNYGHVFDDSRVDDSGVAFPDHQSVRLAENFEDYALLDPSSGMGYLHGPAATTSAREDGQEDIDDFDEDKENVAPRTRWETEGVGAFQSLVRDADADTERSRLFDPMSANERQATQTDDGDSPRTTKRRRLDDLVPSTSRNLFEAFIGLRNQVRLSAVTTPERTPSPPRGASTVESPQRSAPDELLDSRTVQLPPEWICPATCHCYLGSMAFIQKHALVRQLQSDACRVSIVERYQLGGVDIVVDSDHAIVFVPLLALPANIELFSDRICSESWRYSHILVVFEAYPSTRSHRSDDANGSRLAPYAYSPPVCKAIKKLRRLLSIAEGCGTKDEACSVIWAFANDPEETAMFVRCFGEEAYARALSVGNEVLWRERDWLEEEELEDEASLAAADGMNPFAARIMLYQRTLQDILDLSPEARLEEFGELVGKDRVAKLNAVIEKRMQESVLAGTESVLDYDLCASV